MKSNNDYLPISPYTTVLVTPELAVAMARRRRQWWCRCLLATSVALLAIVCLLVFLFF